MGRWGNGVDWEIIYTLPSWKKKVFCSSDLDFAICVVSGLRTWGVVVNWTILELLLPSHGLCMYISRNMLCGGSYGWDLVRVVA